MAVKLRQLAYDDTFSEQAQHLEPDAKRLDEIIDGVIWQIASHAESCPIIEGRLRVAFTETFPDAPAMRIFFSIESDTLCRLHWIERLEPEEEEFGL